MVAQKLVCQGMHRQIGNGESVQVWRDKWLPNPFTYRVGSPQRLSNSEFRENELIDQNMGQWNTDLIHQLFLSYEVDTILGLSTGRSGSGLCPTRNRPDHFGSPKYGPAADPPTATVRLVGRRSFPVGFRSGSDCENRAGFLPKFAYFCWI